jgi:hypothetical protein
VLVTRPIAEKCRATVVATQLVVMQLQPFAIFVTFVAACANQFMRVWRTGYEQSAVGEALFYFVSRIAEDGVILLYLVTRN